MLPHRTSDISADFHSVHPHTWTLEPQTLNPELHILTEASFGSEPALYHANTIPFYKSRVIIVPKCPARALEPGQYLPLHDPQNRRFELNQGFPQTDGDCGLWTVAVWILRHFSPCCCRPRIQGRAGNILHTWTCPNPREPGSVKKIVQKAQRLPALQVKSHLRGFSDCNLWA